MSMSPDFSEMYEFGEFRLLPRERLLLRTGAPVSITAKTFDLLIALVEHAGHLVEKDALLTTVWPDSFVEENNLADNISRLRKALGEGSTGEKFIETVPKRGYRFVAEVKKHTPERTLVHDGPTKRAARHETPASAAVRGRLTPATRRAILLTTALIVSGTACATGFWLYFHIEQKAEVDQLEFRGDFYTSKWTEPEIRKGIEYYNRAIALDPHSIGALSGLASAWLLLTDTYVSPREAMPKAKAAASNALQADDGSAPAHVSLGVIKMQYEWDWAGAEAEFRRAVALDPAFLPGRQLYGWYLMAVGRLDEAQAEMKRALEADPLNAFSVWELGLCYYFERHFDAAIEQYRRAIGVEPRSYWPHMLLGWAFEQQGQSSEAIAELELASRLDPNPQVLASLAHAYAMADRRTETERLVTELVATAKHKYVSPYDIAGVYAGLADDENTLDWLEKAYADRSGWLALWLERDPKFDRVRYHSRFQALLKRMRSG